MKARASEIATVFLSSSASDCSNGSAECSNFSEETSWNARAVKEKASFLEDLHIRDGLAGPVKTALECTSMRAAP